MLTFVTQNQSIQQSGVASNIWGQAVEITVHTSRQKTGVWGVKLKEILRERLCSSSPRHTCQTLKTNVRCSFLNLCHQKCVGGGGVRGCYLTCASGILETPFVCENRIMSSIVSRKRCGWVTAGCFWSFAHTVSWKSGYFCPVSSWTVFSPLLKPSNFIEVQQ